MNQKNENIEEFANWCMKQCTPGYKESCQHRKGGIGWLQLKKKCPILNGERKEKKIVKKVR